MPKLSPLISCDKLQLGFEQRLETLLGMAKGFLIDMDGVVYRGSDIIAGSIEFINHLMTLGMPFLFLTNNSQRTPKDIAIKMRRFGFPIGEEHVYTSAMATAHFVSSQNPNGTAYVIGEGGLLNALHAVNYGVVDYRPDYVIVGEGRTINFEAIERAVVMVAAGAKLIATNLDPNCPTQDEGLRPGCGALVKMLEEATGKKAFSPGKPSPLMFRAARKLLGLTTNETIMLGDTMETDILGGVQLEFHTILVLSGGTKQEHLTAFPYQPELVVNSVADLDARFFAHLASQPTINLRTFSGAK